MLLSFFKKYKSDSIPKQNIKNTKITTSRFNCIYQKLKNKFRFQLYQQQIANNLYIFCNIDILFSIKINIKKSFLYQVIFIIQPNIIILVVLLTIALIKNQVKLIYIYEISIIKLIFNIISKNQNRQKNIEVEIY